MPQLPKVRPKHKFFTLCAGTVKATTSEGIIVDVKCENTLKTETPFQGQWFCWEHSK